MNTRRFDIGAGRRDELTRRLAEALKPEPDVVFAFLHGSFARGEPFHDIDVAVYLVGASDGHGGRALDLADRLSQSLEYPADVRALNEAPLPFQFHVLQGTLLVSHDDERLAGFIEHVGLRYLDMAPLLRHATREAFAR